MNFETVNFQGRETDSASQRRWQQVLAFGCLGEERGSIEAWQPTVPVNPASDVMH